MAGDVRERIEATERKFRLLFDNPHDSIWVLDAATMKILYTSNTNVNIDGRSPEEIVGQPLDKLITPGFMNVVKERLEIEIARYNNGESSTGTLEAEIIAKDGSLVKTDVDFRIFEDGQGLKVLGITRNPFTKKELLRAETELEKQFQEVLSERDRLRWELKILQGLLPICSNCKKIRDENGNWLDLEEYVASHSEAQFTHSICPPCKKELYPFLYENKD